MGAGQEWNGSSKLFISHSVYLSLRGYITPSFSYFSLCWSGKYYFWYQCQRAMWIRTAGYVVIIFFFRSVYGLYYFMPGMEITIYMKNRINKSLSIWKGFRRHDFNSGLLPTDCERVPVSEYLSAFKYSMETSNSVFFWFPSFMITNQMGTKCEFMNV